MADVGPMEIVFLLLLALLLFGAKRLPEIGRSLGMGIREFKDSIGAATHASQHLDTAPEAPIREPTSQSDQRLG